MTETHYRKTCFACGLDSAMVSPVYDKEMIAWMQEFPDKVNLLRAIIRKGHDYFPRLKRILINKNLCPYSGIFDGIEIVPMSGRLIDGMEYNDQAVIYHYEEAI